MPEAAAATFGAIDWVVVVIYLMIVTGIGLWSARGQKSQRDYFLGGRNLPWWAVGFSIVATETSALTFIGIPAIVIGSMAMTEAGGLSASGGNMFFMMTVIGYITGRIVVIGWIIPHYFKGDVYTTYELIFRAFGNKSRTLASALAVVAITLGAGVRVYVTAIAMMVVMQATGFAWFGILEALIIIMLFAVFYVALGGIKAVVWTDLLQYFIFVGAGLIALIFVPSLIDGTNLSGPGGETGWSAVTAVAGDSLSWFNSGIEDSFGATIRDIFSSHNLIAGIIAAPIGIIFAFGFDQMNVQRVLACRNKRDGQKAMGLSAAIIAPQFVLFLLIGAALFAFYELKDWQMAIPPFDPTADDPAPRADYVFPIFIVSYMPPIIKGFLFAAILAAAMSSVSSALGAIGSITVMDFYRPLTGQTKDSPGAMWLSRGSIVVAGVLLIIVAILSQQAPFIFDLAFTLAGLTTGPIMGAFIWGLVTRRGFSGPVIAGMIVAFVFMIFFNIGNAEWGIIWVWHALIGTVVCLAVIAIAQITPIGRTAGSGIGLDAPTDQAKEDPKVDA